MRLWYKFDPRSLFHAEFSQTKKGGGVFRLNIGSKLRPLLTKVTIPLAEPRPWCRCCGEAVEKQWERRSRARGSAARGARAAKSVSWLRTSTTIAKVVRERAAGRPVERGARTRACNLCGAWQADSLLVLCIASSLWPIRKDERTQFSYPLRSWAAFRQLISLQVASASPLARPA